MGQEYRAGGIEHMKGDVRQEQSRGAGAIILGSAVLVILAVVASIWPSHCLWGINHLSYLPRPVAGVLVLLSAAALCLSIARTSLARMAASFAGSGRRLPRWVERWVWLIVPLAALPLLWGFRSSTYLLGDGMLLTQALELGRAFRWTEPLSHYIYTSAYALGNRLGEPNPFLVYNVVNCLAGVLYIALAVFISRDLSPKSATRSFVFWSLVASGASLLYFGYIENYSLFYLACLLFFWIGFRTALGRSSLVLAAVVLSLAITLHLAAVCLIPAWIVLAITAPGEDRFPIRRLVAAAFALILLPLLVAGWFSLTGISAGDIERPTVRVLLPLFSRESGAYAILSFRHLVDVVNEYVLAAWAAVCLSAMLFFRQGRRDCRHSPEAFLVSGGLLLAGFGLVVNPGLGMARDWDLFAVVGLPWLFLALHHVIRSDMAAIEYRRATLALISVALVVTVPWVLVNADEGRSVARFGHLLERYADLPATAYGHEILGTHYRDQRMLREEIAEFRRAAELSPANYRYATNLGIAYQLAGEYDLALVQFERAAEIAPDRFENQANLAKAYGLAGEKELAAEALNAALSIEPGFLEGRLALAELYRVMGRIEEATAEYEKVIRLAPNSQYAIEAQMELLRLHRMEEKAPDPVGGLDSRHSPG
jgi:tetratricopeptide (TPR) repeat protein